MQAAPEMAGRVRQQTPLPPIGCNAPRPDATSDGVSVLR